MQTRMQAFLPSESTFQNGRCTDLYHSIGKDAGLLTMLINSAQQAHGLMLRE